MLEMDVMWGHSDVEGILEVVIRSCEYLFTATHDRTREKGGRDGLRVEHRRKRQDVRR